MLLCTLCTSMYVDVRDVTRTSHTLTHEYILRDARNAKCSTNTRPQQLK